MKKAVIFLIVLISLNSCTQKTSSENVFNKNFVHTVFFWLKNPDSKEDREAFEKSLKKFISNSKYTKTNFIGVPARTPREVVDNSYTYSLIVTFNSKEEHDKYQKEDVHLLFIEESKDLWNKVIVYDGVTLDN